MPTHSRRLAVIMVGDIVGFTAHMAMDERKALAYVGRMRRIVKPLVHAYDGQWIKDIGDGFLASFDSAVAAVEGAVAIQHALREDPAFQLRLGVHLGDVVFEDSDVLGDGVNVAARLEMLAVPGGICASGQVVDLLRNQPELRFARLGVTNLPHSVEAYAIATSDGLLPTAAQALAGRDVDARTKIDLLDAAVPTEREDLRRSRARWRFAAAVLGGAMLLSAANRLRTAVPSAVDPFASAAAPAVLVVDVGHAPSAADPAAAGVPAPVLRLADLAAAGDDDVHLSARFNELLKRTLAQRGRATLLPEADVRALMPRLRLPADAAISPAVANEAARREPRIRAVLVGDVRQVGPRFTLSVDLLDPATGAVLRAWSDDADDAAALLPAMRRVADAVAAAVPAALARLPQSSGTAVPNPSIDVSTTRAESLAPLGDAMAAADEGRWRTAFDRAEQALAIDPDMAMAHVLAAEAERRLGRAPIADHIGRAAALTDTLPAGEKDLVRAAVLRARGDCAMAGAALEAAARSAPALAEAYAGLDLTSPGLALACGGDVPGAVAMLEAQAAAHPDDRAPLDALLRVHLAATADIAVARRAALALERRPSPVPDDAALLFPALELAVNGRLSAAAEALPEAAAAGDADLAPIRLAFMRAMLAAAAGDVPGAAEHTRQAGDLAERQAATQWQAAAIWQLGWLDRLRGDEGGWSRRLAQLTTAFPPSIAATASAWRLADRARAGDATALAAYRRDVAPGLEDRRERAAFDGYIAGQAALARQDPAAARAAFAAAAAAAPQPPAEPPSFGLRPGIALLAQAEADVALDGPRSADAMTTVLAVRGRALSAFADPLAVGAVTWLQSQARAGRLFEASGDPAAAIARYETALRWWGDSPLADAAAVRARVAALTVVAR
ncbi:MAG: adenylate/guanylate cyclase domain-containing protein [Ardenticatenales bacterium]